MTNLSAQYDAKDAVQVYVETPYTNGGVEKAKVVLAAFGKTDTIQAGGTNSATVTLTVNMADIASYDQTAAGGSGAYVLNKGDYKFYLSDNAHSWSGIDPSNVYTYTLASDVVYGADNPRPSDQVAAQNQFGANQNGNYLAMDDTVTPLSRADHFSNADAALKPAYKTVKVNGSDVKATVITTDDPIYAALVTNVKNAGTYQGTSTDTTTGAAKKYTFADMYGLAPDDPAWATFVSQLSIADMNTLIGTAGWSTAALSSIGKPATVDIDGPFGLTNYIKTNMGGDNTHCVSYSSEPVIAATFNPALIEQFGETVGLEANASGTAGWYGPGLNTHRSPFGGRNAEYFSEDPFLSGVAGAAVITGAQSKGLYVYGKHFAFNEMEANRTNMENVWLTEQTARELYLRPFEMAIKDGHATGIMVSYMFTNGEWNGSNYALMTKVVRNEWGLAGMALTDNFAGSWMGPDKAIMAGTDMILSQAQHLVSDAISSTPQGVLAMKDASKHILYAIASVQNNRIVPIQSPTNWWPIIRWGATGVLIAAVLAMGVALVLKTRRFKKQNLIVVQDGGADE